jgi:tetratricopeptide (TPR) repeat protein
MKEERIAKLRTFLERDPNDSFSRYALGLEYAGMGKFEEAATTFQDVLQRDPTYVPAYQHLGYTYQKMGRHNEAVAILKRGIDVARQQGDSHAQAEMQEALDE